MNMTECIHPVLAGILQGRHPADVNFRPPSRAETTGQEPTVVFQRPPSNGGTPRNERTPGKYYIKNADLATNLSTQ